jgi:glycosyltransferase involved in cell wall biosynthesis
MGHSPVIYTTDIDGRDHLDTSGIENPARDGVTIRSFPVQTSMRLCWSAPLAKALRRELSAYDIVHIHSMYLFTSWVAAHYARKYNIPYIVRPHGTLDPYIFKRHRLRKSILELLFEKRNFANAAAVHFTAREEMELARSTGFQFKGAVVPLGVNVGALYPLRDRTPKPKKSILFLGRLNVKKGLDLLAEAFGTLARSRNNLELIVAGPDEHNYEFQVKRWLIKEGVDGNCIFAGMLTGENKLSALQSADIFVLPSYSENFGIAVVEAMAVGLPVVISDRVNIWREIAEAGAGLVVRCDVGELTRALSTLLDDQELRLSMGERGRQLVERSFTWQVTAREMADLYERIVGDHRETRFAVNDRALASGGGSRPC